MTTEDKKISDVYQKAASAEPPAHLDDAILKASRDAVKHTAHAKAPFSGGWPIPVSMVAVIIVAVIIVPVVMQESKQAPKFDTPLPAKVTTDLLAPLEANSDMKPAGKLKQQRLNNLARPQPASEKPMRMMPELEQLTDELIMEDQVESESPAAAPSLNLYEINSSASGASSGRSKIHAETEAAITERKTTIMQGLMKKERAKRVRSAEDWLNDINKLFADDMLETAREELKLFKKAYPDYTIDKKLTDLLEQ